MASIVDIHPHIISTDTARYPINPLGGKQSVWSQERPTSTERLLAEMDAAGVAKAAIVHASTVYGYDNSYVADAVAAHPDRFTGVFSIDMLASDAVMTIKHWVDRNLSGLRLFTTGSTMRGQADWFYDPKTYPAWGFAQEIGLPVCMQVTQAGLSPLRGLLDRFPNVTVILDHLARPQIVEGPPYASDKPFFDMADHPNVYLKMTPLNVTPADWGKGSPQTFFRAMIDRFGADRIAWGSNFPATDDTLAGILGTAQAALAEVSVDERDWIFGKTAQRLYPALKD